MKLYLIGLCLILLCGCASASVSRHQVSFKVEHPVQTIALAPGGGILADAVGVVLSGKGYVVVDTATVSQTLVRLSLSEIEILRPQSLEKFKENGVDAILSVRSVAGYDDLPQSASARLNSTHTGQIVAGMTWQNGWGGQATSIMDRQMRSDIADAADDIADALIASISAF